jgi:hypothetical protein
VPTEDIGVNTNYTEKAKRFMQYAARTTALVIVPLAAVAIAHAGATPSGPVLPASNLACSMVDNGGPAAGCSGGAFYLPLLSPGGLTGVSLFTSSPVSFNGGNTAQLTLQASGLLRIGVIPSSFTVPLAYDFGLQFQDGDVDASVSSWTLDFQLLDGNTVIGDSGTIDNTTIDNGEISDGGQFFTGNSSMTTSSGAAIGDTLTELVTLDVDWSTGDGDHLIVSVPEPSSFDYQGTNGITSVPEPGTMIPLACSLALAGWYRIRRKML